MSQNWHGHWIEDTFKPKNLCNWQVPNWHPKWPDKHCVSTKFQVDNSGRFLPGIPYDKSTANTNFKGTWDLPKKIDRNTANELSAPSRKKYQQWQAHVARNSATCNNKNYNWTKKIK